jgi:hypothetical protein
VRFEVLIMITMKIALLSEVGSSGVLQNTVNIYQTTQHPSQKTVIFIHGAVQNFSKDPGFDTKQSFPLLNI